MAFEWFTFGKGVNWIGKLSGKLVRGRKKLREELDRINDIVYEDPLEIARYYIEPNCQDYNPADYPSEDHLVTKRPILGMIDEFFRKSKSSEGDNQLFILSDAGMGKTALLTMIKLAHLTSFWPRRTNCVLTKLGETTIEEVKALPDKRKTVLLLDSLDEDPTSFGRVQDRLMDILRETRSFRKVVITCRTQFFPKGGGDPFKRPDLVDLGGFVCPVKYLSFFSDANVAAYLAKRFPKKFGLLPDKKRIEEASRVIRKMGSLRCRPMLLSYIDELMASPLAGDDEGEFRVYDALVQSWLLRERRKIDVDPGQLLDACIILAAIMSMRRIRSIEDADLDDLIAKISEVRPIKKIDIKGRSLINRNSDGDWRFSHFSIQEFCVARLILGEKIFEPRKRIHVTDLILGWMRELAKTPNYPELLDFTDARMEGADLKGICFRGANLTGVRLNKADLSGADFSGTDLTDVNLSGANLVKVSFSKAVLNGANFNGANIRDAGFDWATRISNEYGMEFNFIPPGRFMMGSPTDEPGRLDREKQHEVAISKGFYMQTTPVTQEQWESLMGGNPSRFKNGGPGCPVEKVSWNEVRAFIEKLNADQEAVYRLPTEAEWEYACRAGSTTALYTGPIKIIGDHNAPALDPIAWYGGNSGVEYEGGFDSSGWKNKQYESKTSGTHPVAQKRPNQWGLYDMIGNVWEWCEDWYGEYPFESVTDPKGPQTGEDRVVRGGSWNFLARVCRSATRSFATPDDRGYNLGLRLVRSLP